MELYNLEENPDFINLQIELINMQKWVQENNQRVVIIFEGRDSAGKGGAIMRFVRFMNPRNFNIVALNKPTEAEKGQWYFQRYLKRLPDPGNIVFFDRSWYNRAVVEPVMGFCNPDQYKTFMKDVVQLENMLAGDGIYIFKLWFSIGQNEQNKRLSLRKTDPLKQWKLSTVDMQAQLKWDDYTYYKELMYKETATVQNPWVVIDGNDKDVARLEAMRHVLNEIPYANKGKTGVRLAPDSKILKLKSGS